MHSQMTLYKYNITHRFQLFFPFIKNLMFVILIYKIPSGKEIILLPRIIESSPVFLIVTLTTVKLSRFSISKLSVKKSSRSEEHTCELQSRGHLVCRLLLEKKKTNK